MSAITVSTDMHVCNCSCGGVYAITEAHRANCERHASTWACPYCKGSWGYYESEADKLRKQLAAADREKTRLQENVTFLQKRRDEALSEAEHFRKSRDGMKGAMARERKRISKGVCPCCNRHFSHLHRHMQEKHPTFSGEAVS